MSKPFDAPEGRREFVKRSAAALGALSMAPWVEAAPAAAEGRTGQATGVRVGEASDTTAIVWARLTSSAERNNNGLLISGRTAGKRPEELAKVTVPVGELEGACPGAPGRVRVRYGIREDLGDAKATDWADVSEATDYIHQFTLKELRPGTVHHFSCEGEGPEGTPEHTSVRGRFETAPSADVPTGLRFCVMTCQGYPDRGHPDGHDIYPAMQALAPQFACLTGDLVYYDSNEPRAVNARLARYHWERMFSLPRLREFTRNVGTYWLKDDHDTLSDDSWPGRAMGDFTFAEGQAIFRQQAPMSDGPSYRTVRWGRDLQLWFTDGRDHRSPNRQPDGPKKSIWGPAQKAWFKETVSASDATWKVLVSPTPLVGPDRKNKNDNHANEGFRHEGDEIRGWLKEHVPDRFFVICGDRHWQYHSVHPETGLHEFGVGAASDEHAGGTPGLDPRYHKFHRVKGGFLSVTLKPAGPKSTIHFELRDVHGRTVYGWKDEREWDA